MTLALKSPLGDLSSINFSTKNISAPALALEVPAFIRNHYRLTYNNKTRFTFFIREEYRRHFALLRGLIEFNRGNRFSFLYNREAASLDIDVLTEDVQPLIDFLHSIQSNLEGEIAFKSALKNVISFEREYRKLQAKVYAGIFIPGVASAD
jgi:hypothetical protein